MDCSYQAIYTGYVKFCSKVSVTPLSFEDWMVVREGPIPKNSVQDFLNSRTADSGSNFDKAVQVL